MLLSPWAYRSALIRGYAAAGATRKARQVITAQIQGAAEELVSTWGVWYDAASVSDKTLAFDQTYRDLSRLRARLACISTEDGKAWESEIFGTGARLSDGNAECGRDREPPRWGDAWELMSLYRQVAASGGLKGKAADDVANIMSSAVEDVWSLAPSLPAISPLFPDFFSVAGVALGIAGVGLWAGSKTKQARTRGAVLAVVGALIVGAAPRVSLAAAARKAVKPREPETEGD